MAAQQGQRNLACAFAREFGADIGAKDNNGYTPLHHAAWGGDVEMIRVLGEFGADVEATLGNGRTPLHIAAQHGYHQAARVLIEELGADACVRTSEGHTPSDLVGDRTRSAFIGIL